MVKGVEIDMDRVEVICFEVQELVRKRSRGPVEGLYALKACLYLLRLAVKRSGIFIDNEAELDAMLTKEIDEAVKDD